MARYKYDKAPKRCNISIVKDMMVIIKMEKEISKIVKKYGYETDGTMIGEFTWHPNIVKKGCVYTLTKKEERAIDRAMMEEVWEDPNCNVPDCRICKNNKRLKKIKARKAKGENAVMSNQDIWNDKKEDKVWDKYNERKKRVRNTKRV